MGASASHVHSHHNSHHSIHPHTNDAVNWIVTPFPEMGPQALYRLLEMRVEELWSQHYSMDDGHDRDAVKIQARRLEDSLGACKLPDGSMCSHTPEELAGLSPKERAEVSDDFHDFMVQLCINFDVHPVHPDAQHGIRHVCYAFLRGAPFWSLLAIVFAMFGSVTVFTHMEVLTALGDAGFASASKAAKNFFYAGFAFVVLCDLVGLLVALACTGNTAHILFGRHGCLRRSRTNATGHTTHGTPALDLISRGQKVEWTMSVLTYLTVFLMFFTVAAVGLCWSLVTLLTGVCASKQTATFANVLFHSPVRLLSDSDATSEQEWGAGLSTFCAAAEVQCLESEYDGAVGCATDPTETYERQALWMLGGSTVVLFAQLNILTRTAVSIFQLGQERELHTEQVRVQLIGHARNNM